MLIPTFNNLERDLVIQTRSGGWNFGCSSFTQLLIISKISTSPAGIEHRKLSSKTIKNDLGRVLFDTLLVTPLTRLQLTFEIDL